VAVVASELDHHASDVRERNANEYYEIPQDYGVAAVIPIGFFPAFIHRDDS
jgi:hypothetical protein